jgi:prophage regulatory protein
MIEKLLRLPDVEEITGLKRSTIYLMVKNREFPRPVRLTKRASAWRHSEIQSWIDNREVAL